MWSDPKFTKCTVFSLFPLTFLRKVEKKEKGLNILGGITNNLKLGLE